MRISDKSYQRFLDHQEQMEQRFLHNQVFYSKKNVYKHYYSNIWGSHIQDENWGKHYQTLLEDLDCNIFRTRFYLYILWRSDFRFGHNYTICNNPWKAHCRNFRNRFYGSVQLNIDRLNKHSCLSFFARQSNRASSKYRSVNWLCTTS